MAHDQRSELRAQAQEEEAIFLGRMLWIAEQQSAVVRENARCLFEGDSMFPEILLSLPIIPGKLKP